MTRSIRYRELTKADFPDFKRLINNAWHTDSYVRSPAVLDAALDAYMRLCLFKSSYGLVAVDTGLSADRLRGASGVPDGDGKPGAGKSPESTVLGIITGSVRGRKLLFSRLSHLPHLMRDSLAVLFSSRADRRAVFSQMGEFSCDRQLLRGKKKRYGARINFLVVDSAVRGAGIGKTMLDLIQDYFREQGVKRFFLFTDTWCNYEFYDRQGFTCAASIPLPPDPGERRENRVFLYEKDA